MEDNKKSGRGTLWKIVVCVALLVFLVSGGLTLHSYLADKRAQEEYERLAREAAQTTQETITIEETEKQELETEPEKEEYQSPYDFEKLKEENPDTIGWIHIPDTKISYPIVQGTDNDFYLKHDFNGEASVAGSIYLDYESEGDFEGRNNILYGHNMKNGSMFGHLKKFAEDQETYNKSKYFWILTPDKNYRYEIISAYTTGVNSDTYTLFKGPGDEFQSYLETIKGYSEIQTDPGELTIKDKIVTLSTCTGNESTRFVVQGKRDISEDAH